MAELNEVTVEQRIYITIGGTEHGLSEEMARDLYNRLKVIFNGNPIWHVNPTCPLPYHVPYHEAYVGVMNCNNEQEKN